MSYKRFKLLVMLVAVLALAFPAQLLAQTPKVSSCELLANPDHFLEQRIDIEVRLNLRPGMGWMVVPFGCSMQARSVEMMDFLVGDDAETSAIGGREKLEKVLSLLPPERGSVNCSDCPAFEIRKFRLIGTMHKRNLQGVDGPIPPYFLQLEVAKSMTVQKLRPPS